MVLVIFQPIPGFSLNILYEGMKATYEAQLFETSQSGSDDIF